VTSTSRNWAVLVGVAVAALVAAILIGRAVAGGNEPTSRADYHEVVVANRDRVDFALGRLSRAQSLEELLTRMDEAAAVIDKAATELDETNPPADLETENTLLVSHLETLTTDVQGTADQLRTPGYEDLLQGAEGLNFPSWDKVNEVLGDLEEKGVHVELLSRHTT
jgi:hypothetical protein